MTYKFISLLKILLNYSWGFDPYLPFMYVVAGSSELCQVFMLATRNAILVQVSIKFFNRINLITKKFGELIPFSQTIICAERSGLALNMSSW
jgi:hypothetical protein